MKGKSTRDIDIKNQINIFLPFVSTFKEDKVDLQILWSIWLLIATYIGYLLLLGFA